MQVLEQADPKVSQRYLKLTLDALTASADKVILPNKE